MAIDPRPRSDGTTGYRVRVMVNRQSRTKTFDKYRDAVRWEAETRVELERNRHFAEDALRAERTIGDLVDRYVDRQLHRDLVRSGEKGQRARRRHLEWWLEELGRDLQLNHLRRAHLMEAAETMEIGGGPSGKPLKPATINRIVAALAAVLRYGRRLEWTESRVADELHLEEDNARIRYLDEEELPRFLDVVGSEGPLLESLGLLGLQTGARRGELLARKSGDVDRERRLLSIPRSKGRVARSLPLGERTMELIAEHTSIVTKDRWLHPSPTDPAKPTTLPYKRWHALLERAKLEDFRFHDLRHTFASYLMMDGASPGEVAEALGHRSLAMVKRYAHLSDAHMHRVVSEMQSRVLAR
ncbi:MAG: site-specific integrase [Acidobacteriota bacterium]